MPEGDPQLYVVATAGHVDHGKSSLIIRLTGTDPDRLAEEQRRGLTIDLGYAWATLPSGAEIGFVDVPGHERFIRTMLAGVGPVRLVMFVVAADEGWKPQSEEHLGIVDVLGVDGAVVALTKRDLVDAARLAEAEADVRARLRGTALEGAAIVACSTRTGEGIDELTGALDAMVTSAPVPERDGRPRQFVDRVFTIKGAGTIVTGTLVGGPVAVGDEVEIHPNGDRARIRGLQTHKRAIEVARPVSRVAANLAGIERVKLERGDVVGRPGDWRPTRVVEARLRPIRGLDRPLTARGAFKIYAGSAERDVRIRLYGRAQLDEDEGTLARIRLSAPLVLDVHDRFVIREAGRRATVAGGVVLDPNPPARPGADPGPRLAARETASRTELPALLVGERGAIRADRVRLLTGVTPAEVPGAVRTGSWWVSASTHASARAVVLEALARVHAGHPLATGEDVAAVREILGADLERAGAAADAGLVDALLDDLERRDEIAREGTSLRLPSHRVAVEGSADVDRLVRTVAEGEPTPPTVAELLAAGIERETLEAAVRAGMLVRVSAELVMTPAFVARGQEAVRSASERGITVSAFREALGTSRKYALPLLEHFDAKGITRREGDLRIAPGAGGAGPTS